MAPTRGRQLPRTAPEPHSQMATAISFEGAYSAPTESGLIYPPLSRLLSDALMGHYIEVLLQRLYNSPALIPTPFT